jgi:hypothetical protein
MVLVESRVVQCLISYSDWQQQEQERLGAYYHWIVY